MDAVIGDTMRAAGQSDAAIRAFLNNARQLAAGATGLIPEAEIEPVADLASLEALPVPAPGGADAIRRTVMIKLNGGLGTGMGLDRAKSLLEVKDGLTFLDLMARQILHLRASGYPDLGFLLMNSFRTRRDTCDYLARYPELGPPAGLDFLQSQVPKLDAATGAPVSFPANPELEWCPPGHGDIYTALEGSGKLDALLADGIEFAFISNSDNLGATLSAPILHYLREQRLDFLMEVTRRTGSDRKGGHLALRDGRLILRESAQCPDADQDTFQDIQRHRFFNTNNLWIRLPALKDIMNNGGITLPPIANRKTVDPADPGSTPVIQIETAMGAAIACFGNAGAIEVPRSRFAPVKTTADLLVLRSDAAVIRGDFSLTLIPERDGIPPRVDLSGDYKTITGFDRLVKRPPSLKACRSLTVRGPVRFEHPVTITGDVTLQTPKETTLPPATYHEQHWTGEAPLLDLGGVAPASRVPGW